MFTSLTYTYPPLMLRLVGGGEKGLSRWILLSMGVLEKLGGISGLLGYNSCFSFLLGL